MPPVLGPSSASSSRLWSRAGGRARAAWSSHSAIRLASAPTSRSSITTTGGFPSARAGAPAAASAAPAPFANSARSAASAHSYVSQTVTPLPAIRPSALTTTPHDPERRGQLPSELERRLQVPERPAARHPDSRGGRHLAAEGLAPLDPGGGADRPESGHAGFLENVHDPGGERRLGTDDDQIHVLGGGQGQDRVRRRWRRRRARSEPWARSRSRRCREPRPPSRCRPRGPGSRPGRARGRRRPGRAPGRDRRPNRLRPARSSA